MDAYSGDILRPVVSLYCLTMCFLLLIPPETHLDGGITQNAFRSLSSLRCGGMNYFLLLSEHLILIDVSNMTTFAEPS